jgi:hypothetical protein
MASYRLHLSHLDYFKLKTLYENDLRWSEGFYRVLQGLHDPWAHQPSYYCAITDES